MGILPLKGGTVTYEGVLEVDSVSAQELYLRAKRWFVEAYVSSNSVLQLNDSQSNELMGKGNTTAYCSIFTSRVRGVTIDHRIHIQCKAGRYRYQISDFLIHDDFHTYPDAPPETWTLQQEKPKSVIFDKLNTDMIALIASLRKAMAKPESDW